MRYDLWETVLRDRVSAQTSGRGAALQERQQRKSKPNNEEILVKTMVSTLALEIVCSFCLQITHKVSQTVSNSPFIKQSVCMCLFFIFRLLFTVRPKMENPTVEWND